MVVLAGTAKLRGLSLFQVKDMMDVLDAAAVLPSGDTSAAQPQLAAEALQQQCEVAEGEAEEDLVPLAVAEDDKGRQW